MYNIACQQLESKSGKLLFSFLPVSLVGLRNANYYFWTTCSLCLPNLCR